MLYTRPGASIPQFYSAPLFEKKTKDLTENVTVVVLITEQHLVHVQCWAMLLGEQTNLC